MLIHCKFRVLSITSSWDDSTLVSLRPCTAKDHEIDENGKRVRRENPENAQFWKYTPSGEATLTFPKTKTVPEWVKKGAYVYVDLDMTRETGERWDVSLLMFHTGGIEVSATTNLGQVKFGLSEEHAQPVTEAIVGHYLLAHLAARKNHDVSGFGVQWGVSFVPTVEPEALPE